MFKHEQFLSSIRLPATPSLLAFPYALKKLIRAIIGHNNAYNIRPEIRRFGLTKIFDL